MDECMKINPLPKEKTEITNLAHSLLNNKMKITVEDYGAKSKKLKLNRAINQIFGTSGSSQKNALLLYRLSKYFKPKFTLELGTSLGFGTLHLFLGHPDSSIITIEGCPQTYLIAKSNLKNKPIELINQTFYDYIKSLNEQKFDLIFIDGHHDGEALKYYIKLLEKHIRDNTLIILDDIRWSDSMLDAWNYLRKSEQFNLSMDFFKMGVLMKRPKQRKEHFYLRIKK